MFPAKGRRREAMPKGIDLSKLPRDVQQQARALDKGAPRKAKVRPVHHDSLAALKKTIEMYLGMTARGKRAHVAAGKG
jgi:hypothetical protein